MSGRVERARQLRNRRRKGTLPPMQTEDGEAIEMSATTTIACILLLLSIGASMATMYIIMHNPGCWSSNSSSGSGSGSGSGNGAPNVRTPATAVGTTPAIPQAVVTPPANPPPTAPKPAPVPPAPAPAGNVPKCSADQMTALGRQLPPKGCYEQAYMQQCSFTKATAKAKCHGDTTAYYRSVVADMNFQDIFTAVLVGLGDQDETPMDLLLVGSHDNEKYSVDKWRQAVGKRECLLPAVTLSSNKNKAKVLISEPDISKAMQAKRWKSVTGLTDEDLKGDTTQLSAKSGTELTKWAETNAPGPIHYLRIRQGGMDYDILAGGAGAGGALQRVWYLEFTYEWKGDWGGRSLKLVIDNTLTSFACYWQGNEGNLWRISGCWQQHYAQNHWGYIACVNTLIPEAKPIYDKMEAQFQETLKKDLKFE